MTSVTVKNSTIVLNILLLAVMRAGFRLASHLVPGVAIRSAARLMITPMRSSRERARVAAGQAVTREIQVGKHKLAVYTWGNPLEQPYVLFAHGWSSFGMRIAPWVDSLVASGWAVVSFDQQAHGLSSGTRATAPDFADNLVAVATRFGPAAGVIAHSLGAAATMRALLRGLDAERVVLIAPAADMVAATHRFARIIGLAEYLCAGLIRLFETRTAVSFDALQAHRNVGQVGKPLLVVHDLEDREVPWEEGERCVRHASDGRLLSTTGLGHHRILVDQQVIANSLRFLKGEAVGDRVISSPNLPFGVC